MADSVDSVRQTTPTQGAGSTVEQAKQTVQEQSQQVRTQAQSRVRQEVDRRSTEIGAQVSSTSEDLRRVSEEFRRQGKDTPASLAEQVAQKAEQLGGYLTDSDSDRILSDIEDFARRQPWAVAAAGLVVGFAASRFLKASSSKRSESTYSPRPVLPPAPAATYGTTASTVDVAPGPAAAPPPGGVTSYPVDDTAVEATYPVADEVEDIPPATGRTATRDVT